MVSAQQTSYIKCLGSKSKFFYEMHYCLIKYEGKDIPDVLVEFFKSVYRDDKIDYKIDSLLENVNFSNLVVCNTGNIRYGCY